MTGDADDTPPLLQSWLTFREMVLHQAPKPVLDDPMTAFFGGAGTILALLKSAHEQGGNEEFQFAFGYLEGEVRAFQDQIRKLRAEQRGTLQ